MHSKNGQARLAFGHYIHKQITDWPQAPHHKPVIALRCGAWIAIPVKKTHPRP